MTWLDFALLTLLLLGIAAGYIGVLWVLRGMGRWTVGPARKPEPTDDLATAVYELQLVINEAVRPPLEWLVERIARLLR